MVVANHSQLNQPAESFLERNDLPDSPFIGESLAGDDVGSPLHAVKLPIGSHIQLGCFVLGDVEGRS